MNTNMKWLGLGVTLISLALTMEACGSDSSGAGNAANTRPSLAGDRPIAADFTVGIGGDSTFSLSEHSGDVVVLYFSFPG